MIAMGATEGFAAGTGLDWSWKDPFNSRERVSEWSFGGWEPLRPLPSNQVASLHPVTPVDCGGGSSSGSSSGGSGTWGRTGPPKKEELVGGKKKGRTWGPSSTLQKERAGGEERYWGGTPLRPPTPPHPVPAHPQGSHRADHLPAFPAGSRPWGKEANSGHQVPPT